MTNNTVIVEIASPQNNDLMSSLGASRVQTISAILNENGDILYITNCKRMFNEINFNLLPSASQRIFYSDLDTSESFKLFDNEKANSIITDANNVRINALGAFNEVLRTKLIGTAMCSPNMNLALLQTELLVAHKSMKVLVYPNGVHNSVISALSNEFYHTNLPPSVTVCTDQPQAHARYLSLLKTYGMNYTDIANYLTVHHQDLPDIDLQRYDRVYLEYGKGYTNKDFMFVSKNAEHIQQLYIYNHRNLHGYTSSDIQFSGIIDDNIFNRVTPLETVSAYESSTYGSSSISVNPLS